MVFSNFSHCIGLLGLTHFRNSLLFANKPVKLRNNTMLTNNFQLSTWDKLIEAPLITTYAIENRKLDKRLKQYVEYLGNMSVEDKEELDLFGSVVLYTEPESWEETAKLEKDVKEFRG